MSDGRSPRLRLSLLTFACVVAVTTATIVVFATMQFVTVPRLREMAGGLSIFDTRLGYDRGEAQTLLRALGGEGRAEYLRVQLRLDDVFAPLYGVTLSLALAEIFGRAGLRRFFAFALAFLVVLPTAALDVAENAAIAEMLRRPPDTLDQQVVAIASHRTSAKWTAAAIGAGVALVGVFLANHRRNRELDA